MIDQNFDVHTIKQKIYSNLTACVKQEKAHTSNNSNGLPRRYTSFFLLLSSGRKLNNNALHPMSKTAVVPIVTKMKVYGGRWPDVTALIINPSCQKEKETNGI